MKNIFWLLLFLHTISPSCTIQKRTVNKGFFVQWHWNKSITDKKVDEARIHPWETEKTDIDSLNPENTSNEITTETVKKHTVHETGSFISDDLIEKKATTEYPEVSPREKVKATKTHKPVNQAKGRKTLAIFTFTSLSITFCLILLGFLIPYPNLIGAGLYLSIVAVGALIVLIKNKIRQMDKEKRYTFRKNVNFILAIFFLLGTTLFTISIFLATYIGLIFFALAVISLIMSLIFTVNALSYHKRLQAEFPSAHPKKQLSLKNKFRIRLALTFIFLISFLALLGSVTLSQYAVMILLLKIFTYTSLAVTLAPIFSFIFLLLSLVFGFLSGFSARKNFLIAKGTLQPKEAEKKNKVFKGYRVLLFFCLFAFLLALIFTILASMSTYYGIILFFSAVLLLIVGIVLLVGGITLKQKMTEQ